VATMTGNYNLSRVCWYDDDDEHPRIRPVP
jgi:hypothetical protein